MRKIFRTVLLLSCFLTSLSFFSYAQLSYAEAEEGTLYVKVNTGVGRVPEASSTKQEEDGDFGAGQKLKPEKLLFYGIGAGYYLTDNVRGEIVLNNYLRSNYKSDRINTTNNISDKLTIDASSALLNCLIDFYEMDSVKLFTGAGLGIANISGKYTQSLKGTIVLDQQKFKAKYGFAYALYMGVIVNVTSNVDIDLSYSFRDLGKLNKAKEIFKKDVNFRGHYASLGFNFNL